MDIGFILSLVLITMFGVLLCILGTLTYLQHLHVASTRRAVTISTQPPQSVNARIVYAEPGLCNDVGDLPDCCCCMDAKANTLLPCGHANICLQCAQKIDSCPLCRRRIEEIAVATSRI